MIVSRSLLYAVFALLFICTVFGDEEVDTKPIVRNKNGERIIGGTNANWKQYPWIAKNVCQLLGTTEWFVCGCSSTIVHPWYAVTAGHCLNAPYVDPPMKVGLMFSDGDVIEVIQEFHAPGFSRDAAQLKLSIGIVSNSDADVGVQKLAKPITLCSTKQISDLLLYQNRDLTKSIVGNNAKLLGWGATNNEQVFDPNVPDRFSATLQQIDEYVIDNSLCQEVLDAYFSAAGLRGGSPFRLTDSLFCATPNSLTPLVDPYDPTRIPAGLCLGDSGGPLFTTAGWIWKTHHIMGFVTDTLSFSDQKACGSGLDIYTKLTPTYLDWIRSVVFAWPPKN